jgi:hypothetical protein
LQIGARSTPLDGRTGRMQGIFHTSFLLLHFALDRGADTYYGNTTGELGQTLLQFSQKIASGFVESAINQIVSKRMERQQMGWSQRGAHLLLQDTNQEWENIFRRWYPDFRPQGQVKKAA